MEERSSQDELLIVMALGWLTLSKLLLPMRRKSPGACGASDGPLIDAAELAFLSFDEVASLLPLLPPPPPSRVRILLLLPKNFRRFTPSPGPADVDGSDPFCDWKEKTRFEKADELVVGRKGWREAPPNEDELDAESCWTRTEGGCAVEGISVAVTVDERGLVLDLDELCT